tara:strand:+ start:735 stop:1076 length:342 start_codon:yes stop_codon:yes gene_type:complete
MKRIEAYYKGSNWWVNAYEEGDKPNLIPILNKAAAIWHEDWEAQGATDYGSCTMGKGLDIWYRAPRKRSANPVRGVEAPPVQGNLSAHATHHKALEYLRGQGIEATYNDGVMD